MSKNYFINRTWEVYYNLQAVKHYSVNNEEKDRKTGCWQGKRPKTNGCSVARRGVAKEEFANEWTSASCSSWTVEYDNEMRYLLCILLLFNINFT